MLSLEKLLKRLRAGEEEVECFHFDGSVTPLVTRPKNDTRHFMFNDPWNRGPALPAAKDQLIDVAGELERNNFLWKATQSVGGLPLHDTIKYILVKEYRFPLYFCGEGVPAHPRTMDELEDMALQIAATTKALHDAGFIIWDLHPKAILEMTVCDEKLYMLSPATCMNVRTQAMKTLKSFINGCTIVSPYQIMADILCSKFEVEDNELPDFKAKMVKFWGIVLKPEYKHVPELCKFYQSAHQGPVDYFDMVVCRWCKTRRDERYNKTFVIKDPLPLLKPMLFRCIDWFAFGVTMDEFLEKQISSSPTKVPPPHITKAIHDCLCMDEPVDFLSCLVTAGSTTSSSE